MSFRSLALNVRRQTLHIWSSGYKDERADSTVMEVAGWRGWGRWVMQWTPGASGPGWRLVDLQGMLKRPLVLCDPAKLAYSLGGSLETVLWSPPRP